MDGAFPIAMVALGYVSSSVMRECLQRMCSLFDAGDIV